jgi:DNA-binding protein HU-beta
MNITNIQRLLVRRCKIKTDLAEEVVRQVVGIIRDQIKVGGEVKLQSLGTFCVIETKEREGRRPDIGKKIIIPSKKKVRFKASKALKDAINGL